MKLQIAFDDVDLAKCLAILEKTADDIDIIEVGTLFLLKEGLEPIRQIRKHYPDKTILADPKIIDAPEKIARYCFEAGADIVAVMGVASEMTLRKTIQTAKEYGKKTFVDLLEVADPAKKLAYFDDLGADILCFHSSKNASAPPFAQLEAARGIPHQGELAIAGGIDPNSIYQVAALGPDVVIVGSSVYGAKDPAEAVKLFRRAMK